MFHVHVHVHVCVCVCVHACYGLKGISEAPTLAITMHAPGSDFAGPPPSVQAVCGRE